ncbi:hypothetical protein SteCoe_22778 [Stentor coeruleus]|uniref:FYVE-type domain-containing protein n=1 Tax=Stentor coeruleus TaxID=5963 RepID=A0A1R2BLE6_9CILI|nr:hypothetical protein SteCoe_22778 [Stentor coeruleus]
MSKFATFFKSDSENKESKLAAFSQKSTKFFSAMLDSKDTCRVGGCNFKLISVNKFACSSCSQAVCKEHSSEVAGEESQRICDFCRDDKIRAEKESKTLEFKENLFQEIRVLQEDRVSKTREVSKLGSKIRKLENEYKENQTKFSVEQEEMKEKLEKQRLLLAEIEAEYREIKMQLEVTQITEGKASIKLDRANKTLGALKVEVQTLEGEQSDKQSALDELKKTASNNVPIKMIKESLCKLCLMKVSLTHAIMFKNIVPTADEKKPQSQDDMKRNICTCEVY